ncbi:hypothetical protein KGA66_00710 [Actinocrinis puniceicyclus]|uniref:Uncharacterized protein n=1 Tax=Actinocrinis puniceicyclus TaxID=977794 RepID=A0A8J7WG21_9ACTN|nr:hypothetical protein [Actinocrinis puniceicyclus]MBS2961546.1 hypothetical protein [Actinocrinis puniceicyclus]
MASRPSDWSALGLSGDPTPGDVDELQQVVDYLNQVAQATGTIETALQRVLGTASSGNFVGQTSTAMAGQISGRFINFMRDASNAFATAHTAVSTYHAAMLTQQQIAGDALSKAQSSGLKSDDPQVQAWAHQATQAGTDLTTASNTAAGSVDAVSSGTQPISGWDMFWEVLGWIALLLLIPAIIVGGPLALMAFAVNLVLFVKAAVDFGQGKIGFGQFLLAFLGIIAPTTEGLNLAELLPALIKGIGSAAKDGALFVRGTIADLMGLAKGFNFSSIFTVDTLLAIGKFVYTAGVWVMHGIQDLPSLLANGALVTGKALGDFLGKVGTGIVQDLKTGAWVRLVLPVKGTEVANLGLGGAFRVGVLERGFGLSADPVLALKMVAANGLKEGGAGGLKLWSVSSDVHFAADPGHGGLITPVSLQGARPDLTLGLHADPAALPGSGLTTVHTTLTTGPTLLTPTTHALTTDAAHGLPAPATQVLTTNVAHGFTGDLGLGFTGLTHDVSTPTTNLNSLGVLGHSGSVGTVSALGSLGTHDLSHLSVITPTATKLDLGSITTFSHTAQSHAGSVLDLRTPTEINNVYHGSAVVTHLDDFSIVIKDAGMPSVGEAGTGLGAHAVNIQPAAAHTAEIGSVGVHTADAGSVGVHTGNLGTNGAHTSGLGATGAHTSGLGATGTHMENLGTTGSHTGDLGSVSVHATEVKPLSINAAATGTAGAGAVGLGKLASVDHVALSADSVESVQGRLASLQGIDAAGIDRVTVSLPATSIAPAKGAAGTGHASPHPENVSGAAEPAASSLEHVAQPAHDDAGVPGLFGLPSERVAVPWTDFKAAQHEYTQALDHYNAVHPQPDIHGAESSAMADARIKGKAPQSAAQAEASAGLHTAAADLNNAADALRLLDIQPERLQALEHLALGQSLLERPRLLGGSRATDHITRAADDGTPLAATRPVGANHQLNIDLSRGPAHENAALVDVRTGDTLFEGRLTEVGNHGFRLTDPGTGAFHEYSDAGALQVRGFALTDHAGNPLGTVEIRPAAGQATIHHPGGTATAFTYHAGQGAGHELRAPDGTWQRFDDNGALTHQNIATIEHDGSAHTHIEIDYAHGRAHLGGDPARTPWTCTHNPPGGAAFRIDHPTDGGWREFGADRRITGENIAVHAAPGGANPGHLLVDHTGAHPTATHPGGDGTHWTFARTPQGGFRIDHPTDGTWRRFDGHGQITAQDVRVYGSGGQANPDHLVFDYQNRQVSYAGDNTRWTYNLNPPNDAALRIDHPANGNWREFDANGHLTDEGVRVQTPGAANPDHLLVDHRGQPPIATYLGGDGTHWTFARAPQGGFRLDHAAAGDGRWRQFDAGGALTHEDVHLTDHTGANQTHLQIDHVNGDAHYVGGDGTRWRYTPNAHGFRLDHPADGTWRQFDATGRLTGRDISALNHDNSAFGHIEFDYAAGHAFTTTGPRGARAQWDIAHTPGGGFDLTRAHGNDLLSFDANGHLVAQHVDLRDLTGALTGNHLRADYRNPAAPTIAVHDGGGAPVAHLDAVRGPDGHFTVTDTTAGPAHGNFTGYDRFSGGVRTQRINLTDNLGTHIHADFTGPHPALAVRTDRTGATLGHFTVSRDAAGGFHLTDTRGAHAGNERVFDAAGAPVSERINILKPNGKPTGQFISVDYRAGGGPRWTRNDAAGAVGAHDPRLPSAYTGGGAAVRRGDGTLHLTGPDKTPFYSRETLGNGNELELLRSESGHRYWHEWDAAGRVGGGVRHYSTESDGVTSWDLGKWGQVVREYRITADGGLIRAERGGNGFTWTRFDAQGGKLLDGRRDNTLTGWTDTYSANGRTHVVQQKWNTLNGLPHAKHYREYGLGVDAHGVMQVKTSYKELSPQAKDTGSLETLSNGHTLTFTRYAEQRPPDFLWKTPQSLDDPLSKAGAFVLGGKYGAVDFPHGGFWMGDSRFQVFKWVEHDPANHAVVSEGVRTVTPEGSVSDFAGDGVFVRGTIKLDDGHTVEIGRDAQGRWDTFALGGHGGVPAQRTLNWRELDSGKNVVAQGTRTFDGKHWIDSFTDAGGVQRVERHTDLNGDVVHYLGTDKPRYHPNNPPGARVANPGASISVTRNSMGQIVGRNDRWGDIAGGAPHPNPVRIAGRGDEHVGRWNWRGSDGGSGFRLNGRNTRWTGSWDDSYRDFRVTNAGTEQVRDFRALDKGTSLKAEPDAAGAWRSQKFDAHGDPVPGTDAARQWRQADGTWGNARPPGTEAVRWRDLDGGGVTVRELIDGRVREYTNANVWKEFDHGGVWRERTETAPGSGIYLEKESFQKQWRMTDVNGNLLRFRGASGRVWERNATGRWYLGTTWKQVGSEIERKGWMTDLRGANRRVRETNRREFVVGDGASGSFLGDKSMLAQKVVLDFIQDYTIDVAANIIITGAVNNWNFTADDWGKIFAGAAVKSGVKSGYGVISETWLKGTRDGLRNVDGGKDWNRNPYNHDKHADNEWAGNENPQRWRAGTYDYWVGTVAVGALGNFVSTAMTAAAFGVGPNHVKVSGVEALKDGGLGLAAGLLDNLTVGAARTLAHQMSSGRLFHNGGLADITLQFGEKLLEKYLQDVLLNPAAHLKPEPPAPVTAPGNGQTQGSHP